MAGFIKRITQHCYTQNIIVFGLTVLEKNFVCFSHCKYMVANVSLGGAILNPGSITGRIYVNTILHCCIQNIQALDIAVSSNKIFPVFTITLID